MRARAALLSTTLALLAAGCTSVPPGARAISADEIESALSGHTWSWEEGGGPRAGIYFAADKQAEIRWQGQLYRTTWSTRDGAFCYRDDDAGKDRCWALYEKDGTLYNYSLWQPEYSEPYEWNAAEELRKGRHI